MMPLSKETIRIARTRGNLRRSGFTLVEMMVTIGFVGFIFYGLNWALMDSTRVADTVGYSAQLQAQTRERLDLFMTDVNNASSVLNTFTNGANTYTSGPTTLILQEPTYTYDGSNNPSTTYLDTIVYHQVGASAPYTLNRLVVPAAGSPRTAVADTVIASKVLSVSMISLAAATWTGDGSTTSFSLSTPVYGSGSALIESINCAGVTMPNGASAGQAQFVAPTVVPSRPNGTILFGTAPVANSTVNASYSVDPSLASNEPYITSVTLDLQLSITDSALKAATQTVDMVSTAKLRN